MKKVLLLLTVLITLSFSYVSKKNGNSKSADFNNYEEGDSIKDTLKLRELVANFNPKQLNLNNSLLENVALNNFLSKTDKSLIKSSPDYEFFVTMIVLKQYELHKTKFHQGFDLFSMKAGNAGFIVSSFVEISSQDKDIKWLNSSYVMEFIAGNEKLKNEVTISEIVNKLNALPK